MSDATPCRPRAAEVRDLFVLLMRLLETALQLPPGPERGNALEQIGRFQERLARFAQRLSDREQQR